MSAKKGIKWQLRFCNLSKLPRIPTLSLSLNRTVDESDPEKSNHHIYIVGYEID